MSVYKKLQEARVKLQGTNLSKSGYNKFAGYHYFELGDFLPVVQEIFKDAGLCGVVSFTTDVATLVITDIDDNTNITITSPMGSANLKGCHDVQNIGAVETYQRRYLWMAAMEIVEHDALDAAGTEGDKTNQPKQEPEKPWYNDFDTQKDLMIKQIATGKKADQIIKSIRDKYKLSKAIADQIKALEAA